MIVPNHDLISTIPRLVPSRLLIGATSGPVSTTNLCPANERTRQAKTLLYVRMGVGVPALFSESKHGSVVILFLQSFQHEFAQQRRRRLLRPTCCACQRFFQIGVE